MYLILPIFAPFIAAIVCIIAFKDKRTQLAGLKFSVDIRVIERILLALILPLVIFMIGMFSFNTFADSFILLQATDLSVSVPTIIIGHILMAFCGVWIPFLFTKYCRK